MNVKKLSQLCASLKRLMNASLLLQERSTIMHLYYIDTPDGTASVVANNLHEAYELAYATFCDVITVKWARKLSR